MTVDSRDVFDQTSLSRLLGTAAHDLHLIGLYGTLIIETEGNIANKERPDFVAEAIGIQVSLRMPGISHQGDP